jgi:hypothetical protein
MMKKRLWAALFFLSVIAPAFADGLLSMELGHHNYIDFSLSQNEGAATDDSDPTAANKGNRMVQGAYAGFSASLIWRNFLGGLYLNGVFAVTEPNFILCAPGLEAGFMVWYPELFYTVMAHGGPIFHDDKYVDKEIDIMVGAKVRTYSKMFDKNLFFVFGFGMDFYTNTGNMAYTVTVGISRETYFERIAAPPAASLTPQPPSVTIETPANTPTSIDIIVPE